MTSGQAPEDPIRTSAAVLARLGLDVHSTQAGSHDATGTRRAYLAGTVPAPLGLALVDRSLGTDLVVQLTPPPAPPTPHGWGILVANLGISHSGFRYIEPWELQVLDRSRWWIAVVDPVWGRGHVLPTWLADVAADLAPAG